MQQGFAIGLANVGIEKERIRANSGISFIRRSEQIMERIVSANRHNAGQKAILAEVDESLGEALFHERKLSEAIQEYRKALQIYSRLYAADEKNVDSLQSASAAMISIAEVLMELGKLQAAAESFSDALKLVQPLLSSNPSRNAVRIAATSTAGLGDLELRWARKSTSLIAERNHLQQATVLLEQSLDNWRRLPAAQQHQPSGLTLTTADDVSGNVQTLWEAMGTYSWANGIHFFALSAVRICVAECSFQALPAIKTSINRP